MFRSLVLTALVAGCNGPDASERQALFPELIEVEPGGPWLALFDITVAVGPDGRTGLRPELEMNVGGFLEDGISIEASFTSIDLQDLPTTEPGAHTGDVAIQLEPDFAACEGAGHAVMDDGGCSFDLIGGVTTSSNAGAPRVGFIARLFDDDDTFTGDPEAVGLSLSVTEVLER
jgi:hypothetical protein